MQIFSTGKRACKTLGGTGSNTKRIGRYQVEEIYDESTWQRRGYEAFAAQLVNKERIFPCIYGTKGYKANELDFLFLPSEDLAAMDVAKIAAKAIVEYHKYVQSRGRNTSLVLMTPPPIKVRSVEEYHKLFWAFLHHLRRLDPKPWPCNIPQDTTAERWCFNFDDTAAFIAVLTPAHRQRRSRYAANLCMIYQPRHIFDALFTSEKNRISATRTVRNLVDRYDAVPHSPDISDYAKPGTTESRQYFLLDENRSAVCPYQSLDGEVSLTRGEHC